MSEPDRKPGYYAIIPADVRYDEQLPSSAKLLYGELTALADSRGYCWATNQYFADLYGISVKTVSRLIGVLESHGYIRSEMAAIQTGSERRIYAGAFRVTEGGMDKNVYAPSDTEVQGGIDKNVQAPLLKNVQGGMDKNVHLYNKNNTREYNTPLPPEIKKQLTAYSGSNKELLSALFDFAEVRRKKKKPLVTIRQVTLLVNKLDRLSGDNDDIKITMLDTAVLHGWESVYELKPDRLPQDNRRASEKEVLREWT